MYTPSFFQADRAASLAFAGAQGFGTVCAWDGSKPVASPLPFCVEYADDGSPRIAFHVARGNALATLADGKSRWLIAVTGSHTYVSPHWYASPDQVPTWLYQVVHLTGAVRLMSSQELERHLEALSKNFEGGLAPKPPWMLNEVSAGRREMLMKAITGFVMAVDEIEGSFKLNQHKSDADHVAITNALASQTHSGAQELARTMSGMRPHAFLNEASDIHASATLEGKTL
jgi:transcriptional regulator